MNLWLLLRYLASTTFLVAAAPASPASNAKQTPGLKCPRKKGT